MPALAAAIAIVMTAGFSVAAARPAAASGPGAAQARTWFRKLPIIFEANRGQTNSEVKFLSRGSGYALFLTSSGAVLSLSERPSAQRITARVLRMKLVGANAAAQVEGLDRLPGRTSYFIGNDPKKWVTDVPTYAKVRYRNLYPGIDLVFYGNDRNQLEYDFVLAPGANPDAIRVRFEGVEKLTASRDGDVIATLPGGVRIVQHQPLVYQMRNGRRERVNGRCVIRGKNTIGFMLAAYDRHRAVSIDPKLTLKYSTYLGGSGWDAGAGIAVDSAGDVYVAGTTGSDDFPTKNAYEGGCPTAPPAACQSVFVAKFDPSKSGADSLLYSSYFGGNFAVDTGGMTVDSAGDVYIAGSAATADLPVTANAYQSKCPSPGPNDSCSSAFVAELNPSASGDASLVYSTYLGGSARSDGDSIALDSNGKVFVSGYTESPDFPVTPEAFETSCPGYTSQSGCYSNFISELDLSQSGSSALLYSTFFLSGAGINAMAVDSSDRIYLAGTTGSTTLPTVNAFQTSCPSASSSDGCEAAFVAKLDPSQPGAAALLYSTYLGGSLGDQGSAIAVDAQGDAYVTGFTYSTDFPTTANAFEKKCERQHGSACPFVAKLDPSASGAASLLYSTYFGPRSFRRGYGMGNAITTDSSDNVYIAGEVGLAGYIPTRHSYQSDCPPPSGTTRSEGFVAKLNPSVSRSASLIYSTYLCGSGGDSANALAVDSAGNVYVTGSTGSDNFPITPSAFQITIGASGAQNAFVAELALAAKSNPVTLSVSPTHHSFGRKPVGSTTRKTFRVTAHLGKAGDMAVRIDSISTAGAGYSVDPATTCQQGEILLHHASCAVVVDFVPYAWTKYVEMKGQLIVRTDAARSRPSEGAVSLKGGGK